MYLIYYAVPGQASLYQLSHPSVMDGVLSVTLTQEGPGAPPIPITRVTAPLSLLAPDLDTSVWDWLISEDGPYTGGFLVPNDQVPFRSKQIDMLQAVKNTRNRLRNGVAPTPLGTVDIDVDGRINILGGIQMASLLGADFSDDWTMANNEDVPVNASQMVQIGIAAGQYVSFLQGRKRALSATINAATTETELDAIDITAGWVPE
jgi:hypothetical protein